MKAIMMTRGLLGLLGATELVLGVLFWTGHALSGVQLHMTIGILFVLALWTLAILSARAGAPPGLVAFAVGWGVLLPVLGMTQTRLLPGPSHWIIRVLHLLTALVAMGLGSALAARARMAGTPSGPALRPSAVR